MSNRFSAGGRRPWAAVLVSIVLLQGGWLHAQQIDLTDKFDPKDHPAGGTLDGTPAGGTDAIWQATKIIVFAGDNDTGYLAVKEPQPFVGRIAIPPNPRKITVEAEVCPVPGLDGKSNFVNVGIGNQTMNVSTWGPGIYLLVNANGTYSIACDADPGDYESKSAKYVKTGPIADFDADRPTRIKLEYDVKAGAVSAWINGVQVADAVSIQATGVTVDPSFAGFAGWGQKPDIKTVSNFALKVVPGDDQPAPTPQ